MKTKYLIGIIVLIGGILAACEKDNYDAPNGGGGGGSHHHHRTEETVTYTTVIQQPPVAIGAPRTGDAQQPLLWGALILLSLSGSMIIVGKMKKCNY